MVLTNKERLRNWGLPIEPVKVNSKLWSQHAFQKLNGRYPIRGELPFDFTYEKIYEIVEPNEKSRLNRGDVLFLDNWYTVRGDYRGQMVVVLDKYRITKFKPHGLFRDYHAVVMILSGEGKGRIRKYPTGKLMNNRRVGSG